MTPNRRIQIVNDYVELSGMPPSVTGSTSRIPAQSRSFRGSPNLEPADSIHNLKGSDHE